jgi:transcriptional regulator with XRE-family HTH domain
VPAVRQEVEERLIELGDFIRSQREVARISVRRLAELADVSNPYLSQIERGLRKPSADILQQIAKALQISAESLYVRAGILEPDQDVVVSVVDAVHRDPYLSGEQKQTLLRVYESLRAQAAESGSSTEPAGA